MQCYVDNAPGGQTEYRNHFQTTDSSSIISFTLSAIRNDGLDARGINLMKFDGGTDADADGDGGVA